MGVKSKRLDIVFIGSSALGLELLYANTNFRLLEVICLTKRCTPLLENTAKHIGLSVTKVSWKREFTVAIKKYLTEIPFFIYQLDMLVPANLTNEYSFFNLHRGDMLNNRGPNPDIWPILNGDTETALSLHKINDKVDSGLFIDDYRVPIEEWDDVSMVKRKLESGIPQLVNSLYEFLKRERKGQELTGGIYRPWVTETDFTINLQIDNFLIIKRKVYSQRTYNGAILNINGKKRYIIDVKKMEHCDLAIGESIDGDKCIILKLNDTCIALTVNNNPIYSAPPKMPPTKRI